MGRPLKLTETIKVQARDENGRSTTREVTRGERIIELLRAGNFRDVAARVSGIDRSTLYDWIGRGRADKQAGRKSVLADFVNQVEEAEAASQAEDVALIRLAGRKTWQARAWFLERRDPARWGRRLQVQLETVQHEMAEALTEFLMEALPKHIPDERVRARFLEDVAEWAARKPEST